jgi:thiosulfate/3-mercaptopyruvate sulfurtransferase
LKREVSKETGKGVESEFGMNSGEKEAMMAKGTLMGQVKRSVVFSAVLGALVAFSGVAFGAGYVNPALLVDVKTLSENIDKPDWIVVDCRDEKAYADGHLPGAIHLGGACGKVLRDATLRAKKTEDLEKMLGSAGVNMDTHVVVYADARLITSATVAFWILEYLGHDKVHFLNGGIEAWTEGGKPLDKTEKKLPPAAFKAKVVNARAAATEEMVRIAKGVVRDVNVIDSRTANEHKGSDIRSLRGGHIPNTTINVPHILTYDVQTGRIHTMEELEKIFERLDRGRRTIAYCQTGTRSTLTYLELRLMGFREPANYDESWIVYGSNAGYPVSNENWYDFVKVNDAMKMIDELKKAIEELKKQ